MARSNLIGGKKHKKGKKNKGIVKTNKKMETANKDQVYALVKKKVGGSRLQVLCSDTKERSAIIPGKFFKKIWINVGDVLLCDTNVSQDDSLCYIVQKYTIKEANKLKELGEISFEVAAEEVNENLKFSDHEDEESIDLPSSDDNEELIQEVIQEVDDEEIEDL
jgi:translation initiation factor 1A